MDAAWSDIKGKGGYGWIVRDHEGRAVFGGCKFISKGSYVSRLEAEAILAGLKLLVEECLGPIPPLEVESDAFEVIRLLNRELVSFAEIGVIENILYFVNSVNIKFFCHSVRTTKRLIRLLSLLRCSLIWKDVFSDSLLPILDEEYVRE